MTTEEIKALRAAFMLIDRLAAAQLIGSTQGAQTSYLNARRVLRDALPEAARP